MIFGQFREILLLGISKYGRSLWVKKWISFLDWCDGVGGAGAGEGKHFRNCLIATLPLCLSYLASRSLAS